MSNKKNCIYIYSIHPIFNSAAVKQFENFTKHNSVLLFSDLLANFIEILLDENLNSKIIYCLDKQDENHIPNNFLSDGSKVFFTSNDDLGLSINKLNQDYFTLYENNILVRADAIGITVNNIYKIFDLLIIEDDALVLGQSINNKVAFIGFNSFDKKLLEKMFSLNFNYQDFLIEAGKSELFLNTFQGFQLIENFADFNNLYINLSKKESLSYCSQEMHERFTNLFIEYKDLLT